MEGGKTPKYHRHRSAEPNAAVPLTYTFRPPRNTFPQRAYVAIPGPLFGLWVPLLCASFCPIEGGNLGDSAPVTVLPNGITA